MNFMIPSNPELELAEKWWQELPDWIKAKQSIWVILAMYAEHVLKTRTVHFDADEVTAEIGKMKLKAKAKRAE